MVAHASRTDFRTESSRARPGGAEAKVMTRELAVSLVGELTAVEGTL